MEFNTDFFFSVQNLTGRSSVLDSFMVFGAYYLIYIAMVFLFLYILKGKQKEKKAALVTALGLLLAAVMIKLIRVFVVIPRPFDTFPIESLIKLPTGLSFPSVHTAIMATIYFGFALSRSKVSWLLLFLLVWVGFARIYVGVHYPFDILGGIVVGLISIVLAYQIKRWLKVNFV